MSAILSSVIWSISTFSESWMARYIISCLVINYQLTDCMLNLPIIHALLCISYFYRGQFSAAATLGSLCSHAIDWCTWNNLTWFDEYVTNWPKTISLNIILARKTSVHLTTYNMLNKKKATKASLAFSSASGSSMPLLFNLVSLYGRKLSVSVPQNNWLRDSVPWVVRPEIEHLIYRSILKYVMRLPTNNIRVEVSVNF